MILDPALAPLSRWTDAVLLIARLTTSIVMVYYGWPKLMDPAKNARDFVRSPAALALLAAPGPEAGRLPAQSPPTIRGHSTGAGSGDTRSPSRSSPSFGAPGSACTRRISGRNSGTTEKRIASTQKTSAYASTWDCPTTS
jgi:hypothetical protein